MEQQEEAKGICRRNILPEHHPGICPAGRHISGCKGARRVCASGKRATKGCLLRFGGSGGAAVGHPFGIFDDKKICKEVRQELRERPRYWRRALAVYWAVIVAIVVVVNVAFPTASESTIPTENEQVEVPQRYRDYLSLHFMIGARQEAPNEALQRQIDQDERTTRYGQPVYAMQVRATKGDMGGEFRVGLLNHATFDEIRDGTRKFAECTWGKGYTSDSIRILLTVWYEMKKVELCPVDSLEWTEDTRF